MSAWNPNDHDGLLSLPLFTGMTRASVQQFSETLESLSYGPGELLFREGDEGGALYVLLNGEVEVMKLRKDGANQCIALLGPGDFFGEMSLVHEERRSATVMTTAATRALRIGTTAIRRFKDTDASAYAQFMENLVRNLAQRLRVADTVIADLGVRAYGRPTNPPKA